MSLLNRCSFMRIAFCHYLDEERSYRGGAKEPPSLPAAVGWRKTGGGIKKNLPSLPLQRFEPFLAKGFKMGAC
ncbi:hypothetical protein CDAR_429541 [Caerostris darwini]|uniref:Uncharacterized protein n=1 Tax=Caerostris darwini TaxID=1538125 RepID=A0AAV4UAE8_9ARAC|nr:hypothetical protein CDAR_429541 [Caerostris darwini]